MRIATTYEDGQIFQHFGSSERFKIYDIKDGEIASASVVGTNGSGHGALAEVLHNLKVDVLICGGIGGGAQAALSEAGIKLYAGVSGNADKAVADFLGDKLEYSTSATCNHHDEHGEEHHCCGEHHGGDHCCGEHD